VANETRKTGSGTKELGTGCIDGGEWERGGDGQTGSTRERLVRGYGTNRCNVERTSVELERKRKEKERERGKEE